MFSRFLNIYYHFPYYSFKFKYLSKVTKLEGLESKESCYIKNKGEKTRYPLFPISPSSGTFWPTQGVSRRPVSVDAAGN